MGSHHPALRVAMYSHDTFGLGHITRTIRLAGAALEAIPSTSVLVLTGSPIAHRISFPPGVDYVKLPGVRKRGPEKYEPRGLDIPFWRLRHLRMKILEQTVRAFRPHLLLVDNVPLGMKGEILPVLEYMASRRRSGARTHLNLRDILDEPEAIRKSWDESGAGRAVEELYDEIHVFGDPAIHDAISAYSLPVEKSAYYGYIAPPRGQPSAGNVPGGSGRSGDVPRVLVTIGGGDDGAEIIRSALAAQALEQREPAYSLDIVLGPFFNPATRRELIRRVPESFPVRFRDYVGDLCHSIAEYDLVLSMGGYNTLCEVMASARRSLVVPRVYPRREQELRARALEARGILRVLPPAECSPERLDRDLRTVLGHGPTLPSPSSPPLDGLARFRARFREVAARAGQGAFSSTSGCRTRKSIGAGRLLVLFLGLFLATPKQAQADLRPSEASAELLGGYDTNILNASDAEIRAFETQDPGSYFVVQHMKDALLAFAAEGRWSTHLFGTQSEARIGYGRLQYAREPIRSENSYAFLWRTHLGPQTLLDLGVDLAPHIYGRHRRDKDAAPGDPLFRPEIRTEWDFGCDLERRLGSSLTSKVGLEATIRDYNEPFNERDRTRVGGRTGFVWRSGGGVRLDLSGGYRRLHSRNEPYLGSDLSYREWTLRSAIQCDGCLGGRAILRAQARRDWTRYTSSDPDDESHFGRVDAEWELDGLVRYPLSAAFDWKATIAHAWRSADFAGVESIDEEGSFRDTFVTTGVAWHWKR